MHEAANNETADSTACKVQRGALLHTSVADELSLGQEVRGQLDGATEAGSDHGSANTTVQPTNALSAVDAGQAVERIAVLVLGADGAERRVALQARLDEEKGAAGGGANHARGGAAEHVDEEVLGFFILQEQASQGFAHGVVEAETAAIEEDLVDVGGAETAVYAPKTFVAHDDTDAMDGAPVVVRL
jgi:hypothetical protein